MKISAIAFSVLFFFATAAAGMDNKNLRSPQQAERDLEEKERELLIARDLLNSDMCSDLVNDKVKKVEEVLKFGESTIINFFCNPIERKKLLEKEKMIEKDLKDPASPVGDSCERAYDNLILNGEGKQTIKKALKSWETCKAEIKKELKKLKSPGEGGEVRRLRKKEKKLPGGRKKGKKLPGGKKYSPKRGDPISWDISNRLHVGYSLASESSFESAISGSPIFWFDQERLRPRA